MVHTVEPLSTRLVLAPLARITAPNVQVVRPGSPETQRFVVDAEGSSSYPIPFSNNAPILQRLVMSSIILTWVSSPVSSNLTTLYLGSRGFSHSVVAHSEASANELCALFRTANRLTGLHLIGSYTAPTWLWLFLLLPCSISHTWSWRYTTNHRARLWQLLCCLLFALCASLHHITMVYVE